MENSGEHVVADHHLTPFSSVRKETDPITELDLMVPEPVVAENGPENRAVSCTGTVGMDVPLFTHQYLEVEIFRSTIM